MEDLTQDLAERPWGSEQFKYVFPRGDLSWVEPIFFAWEEFGFLDGVSRAGFLGICGNETGGFSLQIPVENMRYTMPQALANFKKAREHPTECEDRLKKGWEAFANWIYAGVNGNGDEASGDGARYRGRGIIQLTGKENYLKAGKFFKLDLVQYPETVARDQDLACRIAGWFMAERAKILHELMVNDEDTFLQAAGRVGWANPQAKANRLEFRRRALEVLA